VKAGERLGEAIEIAWAEDERNKDKGETIGAALSSANPFLLGMTPSRFILHTLRQIKAPELEQALLVLPLVLVQRLLTYLSRLLDEGMEVELCWRCIVFVLRIHHTQIVTNRALITTLERLRSQLREKLIGYRDLLGYNMAALHHLQRQQEAAKNAYVIDITTTTTTTPSSSLPLFGEQPMKKAKI